MIHHQQPATAKPAKARDSAKDIAAFAVAFGLIAVMALVL